MKKNIVVAVICLLASVASAQKPQPLNAKTGEWQITLTVNWTGLPPQYAAAMKNAQPTKYTSCVKAKDLNSNPWAEPDEHCAWTVLKSNGTDMEVQGKSCQKANDTTADVRGTVHMSDPEHGTGTFDITLAMNGQTMKGHANYTGKWLSATCED